MSRIVSIKGDQASGKTRLYDAMNRVPNERVVRFEQFHSLTDTLRQLGAVRDRSGSLDTVFFDECYPDNPTPEDMVVLVENFPTTFFYLIEGTGEPA